ncbi:MAG TPA: hypothetical protein VKI19_01785 [Acidimicrobiales bacterium]|nr:hypothetical protein [Acidimicrobiales bacterium]
MVIATVIAISVVIAAAGLVAGVLVAIGSPAHRGAAGDGAFATPAAYHVVYRVTSNGSASTESLWVARPFESADVDLGGAPPGQDAYLTVVYRLGDQVTMAGGGAQALLMRVPAAASPADVRPDVIAAAALQAGLLRRMGHERIAGRSCTVYRSAAPLRSGPLTAVGSGSTYTDTCIDGDGLILGETVVKAGAVTSERVAVHVSVGAASTSDAEFSLSGPATPVSQGGGAFTPLTPDSRPPGINWTLGRVPPGFEEVGRYAVIPPQPGVFGQIDQGPPNQLGLPGSLVAETDIVWVRGPDVIVLQQGGTLNGARFAAPAGARPVDLGAAGGLGPGQLEITGTGSVVSAEPASAVHFLRLSGTLDPSTMLALARSIVRAPPGTLTRLDGTS